MARPAPRRKSSYTGQSRARYGETRVAWITGGSVGNWVLYERFRADDGSYAEKISLHDLVMYIPPMPGSKVQYSQGFNLSNMTEDELNKMRQLWNMAFDMALETVKARDRNAEEDEYDPRNYRPVPNLFVRERPKPPYSQELRERPEGTPEVVGEGESGESGDHL